MLLRVSQVTFLCWQDTAPTIQNKPQWLWELHKSCWLWFPSKVKAKKKPSRLFPLAYSLCLLHSTQIKTLSDISQWSVDDNLSVIFFSLQVNTEFIWGKKIKYRLDKGIKAVWQASWWSHWVTKMVPPSLKLWTLLHALHTPTYWWPLLFLHWSMDACSHQLTFPPPDCFHIYSTSSGKDL